MERSKLYSDHNELTKFIETLSTEELSSTEVIATSSLQRQKSQLENQKLKAEEKVKSIDIQIAKLEAKMATMQAT